MTGQGEEQTRIGEQAAEWAVRLAGGPLDEAERRAFERWRSQSPRHADALRHARGIWDDLAGLGMAGRSPLAPVRMIRPARRRMAGWAVAAGLLLAVGLAGGWAGGLDLMLTADHRTVAAELRSVTLPDGSVAELGPASAIAVRFGEGERRVALLSGAAYFTVAPVAEPHRRPFLVETANGTARALGTRFAVNRLGDAVEVAVAEHAVRVAVASAAGAGDSVTVEAGQSVRYDRRGGLGPVAAADVAQATAWRRGRLVFDRVPLGSVVDSLNRYRRDRIVLADLALAGREVSGVFDTARLDDALAAIAREMNVRILSVPPLVTLLY